MARFPQESIWAKLHNAYNQGVLDSSAISGGKLIYFDPVDGSNVSGTGSHDAPYASLSAAYAQATSGKNDVLVFVSKTSSSVCRVDTAFTWGKSSTHLVSLGSGGVAGQYARLAPTLAVDPTFANFFTLSGHNCLFSGISFFHDFTSDPDNMIGVTVSGSRNTFRNCEIASKGKAADAAGRDLKFTGTTVDFNLFENCVIGNVAGPTNPATGVSVEYAASTAAAGNIYKSCVFYNNSAAGGSAHFKASAGSFSKYILFDDCKFINGHASNAQDDVFLVAASAGGWIILDKCSLYNVTGWGDATAVAQIKGCNVVSTAATAGLGTQPAA